MAAIAPYIHGLGCICDPFDDGPFGHDPDCPAEDPARAITLEWQRAAPLLAELSALIGEQDSQGRGAWAGRDAQALRAATEDLKTRADAARSAARAHRKSGDPQPTRDEVLGIAAAALRLLRDLDLDARLGPGV